jgi:hypothetical protein
MKKLVKNIKTVVIVAGVTALGAAGYYIYKKFFKK